MKTTIILAIVLLFSVSSVRAQDSDTKDAEEFEKMFQEMKECEKNIGSLEIKAKATPRGFSAQYELGRCFHVLDKNRQAVAPLRRAVALRPNDRASVRLLADVYREIGDLPRLSLTLEKLAGIGPADHLVYMELGVSYRRQKRLADAADAFRSAINIALDQPAGYMALGATLSDMGRSEEALPFFVRATELDPLSPQVHELLGGEYYMLRRYEEAKAAFVKAISLEPKNAKVIGRLGSTLACLKDFDGAMKQYELLKTIDVEEAEALLGFIKYVRGS